MRRLDSLSVLRVAQLAILNEIVALDRDDANIVTLKRIDKLRDAYQILQHAANYLFERYQ